MSWQYVRKSKPAGNENSQPVFGIFWGNKSAFGADWNLVVDSWKRGIQFWEEIRVIQGDWNLEGDL